MDIIKPTSSGMEKKNINKNIIIIASVIIVIAIIYFVFFRSNSNTNSSGSLTTISGSQSSAQTNNTDVNVTSQQFLTELLNIDSIKIDPSIENNPAFTVLVDYSKPITPDTNPGRVNPFAPLGSDSSTVSTQIVTNTPTLTLATSAVLNGTLMISGQNVTRWFEYGTTDALGTKTAETPQTTAGGFSENITGLLPNTTYYVKAVASIGGQLIYGALVNWQSGTLKRS